MDLSIIVNKHRTFTILIFCAFFLGLSALKAQTLSNKEAIHLLQQDTATKQLIEADNMPTISSAYRDNNTDISYIYLQQTYQGIPLYNVIKTIAFKNNRLQYISGKFYNGKSQLFNQERIAISALAALQNIANYLKLPTPENIEVIETSAKADRKILISRGNLAKQPISVSLVWVSINEGVNFKLAWNVSIDVINSSDYWNIRVDAKTGEIIDKNNYTVYENVEEGTIESPTNSSETFKIYKNSIANNTVNEEAAVPPFTSPDSTVYNVVPYPFENRYIGAIALEKSPWQKAGYGNNATNYGWHYDGVTNYNYTRGNNVFAYDDSLNVNTSSRVVTASSINPVVSYNFTLDTMAQPTASNNRQFATTNLFYWNNIMHDVSYQYGFTEAAGNFQNDNLGRGGLGTDYVNAESQDGGGTNNANFSTPPDGSNPRMQMYLYKPLRNLFINSPTKLLGNYIAKEGVYSTKNLLKNVGPITGNVVLYNNDATGTVHNACIAPVNNIQGKIALIILNSSGCLYALRAKNAQTAGAIAIIVVPQSGSSFVMGGTDTTVVIPSVVVDATTGNQILTELNKGTIVNVTLKVGPYYDGDLDNGIISHEYTHGISFRLTGGPGTSSCLSNAEQGGEGWSDYVGLMMTTNWAKTTLKDSALARSHAAYATQQDPGGLGNRTYPYSTSMTVDPHTYSDMSTKGEVHYIGEIWCSVLWDMTWNIIKQVGVINPNLYNANGGGGNVIALQLVIQGMKLQPCSPGFIDARNAILAADSILYGGAYHCAIWSAFARRGMGKSASQGSSNSTTDQTVAFDNPCNTIYGKITTPSGVPIPHATIKITGNGITSTSFSDSLGNYSINTSSNKADTLTVSKPDNGKKANGVSTIDISLIQQHILKKNVFTSPYLLLAGDANTNGAISTLDLTYIKRLILGLDTTFPSKQLWLFVDTSQQLGTSGNVPPFIPYKVYPNFISNYYNQNFYGIRIGDINYDWNPKIY